MSGPTAGGAGSGPNGNDAVNSAGSDTGGNANTQDGGMCSVLSEVGIADPLTVPTNPDGLPPIANYSLIGARPHDLGAMLRGGGGVPTPGFDEGKSLEWSALAETPMTHRHGYGVSFAIGNSGTVSPSSGAFVHPFTLLTLPATARRMGLALELEYSSNAEHAIADPLPFSSGYVLSGNDLLMETEGSTGTAAATKVTIARGDGLPARYTLPSGSTGPVWTYTAPASIYDTLTAEVISGVLTYTRTLRDGRRIIYNERVATSGFGSGNYVRSKVIDGYGNQILYTWTKTAGFAYLATITDTRGVQLVFTTDYGSPRRVTKLAINAATVQLTPTVAAADLEINFSYTLDGARRLQRIQWFRTRVVADADGNGVIVSGENNLVQPAVDLVYETHDKLAEIWNSTRTPSTRQIQNEYALHTGFGVRVITQREGGTASTGVATHTYLYPTATTRTYVDPRGTTVSLGLDTERRINVVTMQADTNGKPRDAEPTTPGDFQSLSWTVGYGCCGLPTTITESSSGRVWTMSWDANSLLRVSVNGTPLHTFTHVEGRMLTWTPANDTTPRLTVAYNFMAPASGAYSSVVLTTRAYADARSVVRPAASITLTLSATGQLVQSLHNQQSIGSTYSYAASGSGHGLLRTVAGPAAGAALALTYTCDDLGRLSAVQRGLAGGTRTTSLVVDTHHRVETLSAPATAGGPALTSEAYYDEFGEVSWERTANRDEDGNLRPRPWIQSVVVRDALCRPTKRFRDSALVTAAQESMLLTRMTWAADHRLDTIVQPNGATTTYVFDGYGYFYKATISASGFTPVTTTRYFYDENGQLVLARNALNHGLQILRHPANSPYAGLVHKVIDPAQLNELEFEYDSHRRLWRTHVRNGAGNLQRLIERRYDDIGQLDRIAIRDVLATFESSRIHMYDGVGRLVEVGLQADSTDTAYLRGFRSAFDDYGRMLHQRDRLSDQTSTSLGDLWNQVSFTYHALTGLPDKMIEREIEQAAGQFGPLSGSGSHTVHTYETHLGHDLLDRVISVDQKPEGITGASVLHRYFHDSFDEVVRFQDSLNAELSWVHDGLGQVRRRTERGTAGGEITTTTDTDYVTGVVTRVDAEQRTSRFYHDKAWRLTKQELPGAAIGGVPYTHVFDYDSASRVRWMVNGNGAKINRLYDAAGRLTTQYVEPNAFHSTLATLEVYQYNAYGNVSQAQTFAGPSLNIHVITEQLNEDPWGRRTSEIYDFGGVTRTMQSLYDVPSGAQDFLVRRRLTVPDAYDLRTEVDGLGRSWQYTDAASSTNPWVAQYRFIGQRVRERQQGSSNWLLSTSHEWDSLRRLSALQTNRIADAVQLSRFEHEFDLESHLKKRKRDRIGNGQPAGVGDWFKLDEYYRLAGVKLGVGASQFGNAYTQGSDYDAVSSYQRAIDYSPAAGPLDKAQSRHLVRETVGSTTTDTVYTQPQPPQPLSHRYDTVAGVPLIYDYEGNTLFDGSSYYLYDFKNRLSEVYQYLPASGEQSLTSGSGSRSAGAMRDRPRYLVPRERLQRIYMRGRDRFAAAARTREGFSNLGAQGALADQSTTTSSVEGNLQLVAAYTYDPYNRRVMRLLLNQPILYSIWDGWREVAEYSFGGSGWVAQRSYVWGERLDELVRFSNKTETPGTWTHYYPQHDHQDSVDMLVKADGTPKEKYEYDPFGGVQVYAWTGSTWSSTSTAWSGAGNQYLFTGRRFDSETGLGYYRNRYYSTVIGRFLTEDPVGLWGDEHGVGNPYQHCGNSPAFLVDPSGFQVGLIPPPPPSLLVVLGTGAAGTAAIAGAPIAVGAAIGIGVGFLARWAYDSLFGEESGSGQAGGSQSGGNAQPKPEEPGRPITRPGNPRTPLLHRAPQTVVPAAAHKPHLRPGDPGYVQPPTITNWGDPTKPPDGSGWDWRGTGPPGSGNGNWCNGDDSMSPDFNHPPPIMPHWDWVRKGVGKWRVFFDGTIQPK